MRKSHIVLLVLLGCGILGTYAQSVKIPGLIAFRVEKVGDDAQLEWTMEEEFLMYDFVIERSLNNTDYSAVGIVPAGGSMRSSDTYGYLDENIVMYNALIIFYRLVQIGPKGQNYHSKSIEVSQLDTKGIIVDHFPHPEKPGVTNIAYLARGEGELLMQITNSSGETVFFDELPLGDGFKVKEFKNLPRGTYYIKVFDDKYAVSETMILE
jgi:hypothetical protein